MKIAIDVKGTAFKAVSTQTKQRTQQELRKEEESQTKEATEATETKDTQKTSQEERVHVLFEDPQTKKLTKVELTTTNLENLQSHFENKDFFTHKDGTVRLNGKAESFVSGWYGDIAYNREFLKADSNEDGSLSDDEYKNTKNGFRGYGLDKFLINFQAKEIILESSEEEITQNYVSPSEEGKRKGTVRYNDDYQAHSLEEELNTTLRVDKNFDGEMTLSEAYQANKKNENKNDGQIVISHTEDYYHLSINNSTGQVKGKLGSDDFNATLKKLIGKKRKNDKDDDEEEDEKLTQAQKAMQKLIASNGNERVLSAEEKQAIQGEIHAIKKDIAQKINDDYLLNVIV